MYIAGCAHRKRNKRVAPNIASVRTLVLVRHCPVSISEMQVCGKRKTIRNEKNELQAAMVISVWLTLCFPKSLSSVTLNIPDIFQRGREIKGNRKQKWLRHFSKRNTNENYFPNEKKKEKKERLLISNRKSRLFFLFNASTMGSSCALECSSISFMKSCNFLLRSFRSPPGRAHSKKKNLSLMMKITFIF